MCGIAGVIGEADARFLRSFRDRAFEMMQCRGPDGAGAVVLHGGVFHDAASGAIPDGTSVLLVHRRLAVLDRTESGAQPMKDELGRFAISYNGEVYNYEELRRSLGSSPGQWRGTSDTEVVLQWLMRGRAISECTGMFALALADAVAGSVTLVRDAFGIKPLFWAELPRGLAFASDPRLLLGCPGVSDSPDDVRAMEFLRYGAVTTIGERTAFAGVKQVMPGSGLTIQVASGHVSRFRWFDDSVPPTFRGSFAQAVTDVREVFLESVRLHLKADVRVGCALSGGIDSSAVVCGMRQVLGSHGEIHAVSHIASERRLSEEHWIDCAAAAAGAVVHKVRPVPEDLPADLDDLVAAQGEPVPSTSLYAQYRVFSAARDAGLTVMLDGQGADELLAGYTHFLPHYLRDLLSMRDVVGAVRLLRGADERRTLPRLGVPMLLARHAIPVRVADRLGAFVGRPALPEWIRFPDAASYYAAQETRRGVVPGLRGALDVSLFSSLQGLLRYEDRNSMRFSIESRVPFLERELVRLLRAMPPHYLVGPRGETKYVFREAMRGIVPDEILDRQDKIGFENDEARWLTSCRGWVDTVLAALEDDPLLSPPLLRTAWAAFLRRPDPNLAKRLWASFLYLRWRQLCRGAS